MMGGSTEAGGTDAGAEGEAEAEVATILLGPDDTDILRQFIERFHEIKRVYEEAAANLDSYDEENAASLHRRTATLSLSNVTTFLSQFSLTAGDSLGAHLRNLLMAVTDIDTGRHVDWLTPPRRPKGGQPRLHVDIMGIRGNAPR